MMEAYAVFEGGGVKGAAFTGALKAAEENKIEFVGYGGASAGAIVAYLSSIGLEATDILAAMKEYKVSSLLNEWRKGDIENCFEVFSLWKKSKLSIVRYPIKYIRTICFGTKALLRAWRDLGIFDDRNFISFLSYYLQIKHPDKMRWCDEKQEFTITFDELYKITSKELKIVATDLNTGSAKVFSHRTTPNRCVFRSIVASSSYPFVFKPQLTKSSMFIDGGVSCNLPTYLFHGEQYKNLPIFAFDLFKDKDSIVKPPPKKLVGLLKRLMGSMLDASTDIISDVVGGIGVPVKVPEHVSTLNFNASDLVIDELYESGYSSAKEFFDQHPFTVLVNDSPTDIDRAKLLFGNCHEVILRALVEDLNVFDDDIAVKAWLYTSINAIDHEIVSFAKYTVNGEGNHHAFLLNERDKDCVTCWIERKIVIINDPDKGKVRVCFPILKHGSRIKNGVQYFLDEKNYFDYTGNEPILGVLCVSVDTTIEKCAWFEEVESGCDPELCEDVLDIASGYIAVIEKAMLGSMSTLQFNVESSV